MFIKLFPTASNNETFVHEGGKAIPNICNVPKEAEDELEAIGRPVIFITPVAVVNVGVNSITKSDIITFPILV
jgi:hypothetical protein